MHVCVLSEDIHLLKKVKTMTEDGGGPMPFKIALAQIDPKIGDIAHNRERIAHFLGEAARGGAKLVVFPECALSGYVFGSADEAMPYTETVPGETTAMICELCRRYEIYAVV